MTTNKKTMNPFEGELFLAYETQYNYLVIIDKELVTKLQSKIPTSDPEYQAITERIVEHRKKIQAFTDDRKKIMFKYRKK